MKKFLLVTLLLIASATSAFAQSAQTGNCLGCSYDFQAYFDDGVNPSYTTVATMHTSNAFNTVDFDFVSAYMKLNGTPIDTVLAAKQDVSSAFSGAYSALTGKPTNLSQFTNNLSFISASGAPVQSVNGLTGVVTVAAGLKIYSGTTLRSNPILITKSGTTTSGVATFYLTNDNTSTGTALCPNGVETTAVNMAVNDSTGMFTYSWAFTNSNKTLTATVKALNLLALGLGNPANGTAINASVVCY